MTRPTSRSENASAVPRACDPYTSMARTRSSVWPTVTRRSVTRRYSPSFTDPDSQHEAPQPGRRHRRHGDGETDEDPPACPPGLLRDPGEGSLLFGRRRPAIGHKQAKRPLDNPGAREDVE